MTAECVFNKISLSKELPRSVVGQVALSPLQLGAEQMRGAAPAFVVALVAVGSGGANACDGCERRSYYQFMPAYFLAPPAYRALPRPGDYVLPSLHGRPYYEKWPAYPPPGYVIRQGDRFPAK